MTTDVKGYYRNYLADDALSELSQRLMNEILKLDPVHVFEFGYGSGKHLKAFHDLGIEPGGIDISFPNFATAAFGHKIKNIINGDETNLRHVCNYDIVYTCSVLDHCPDIDGIIGEFKRIANKAVFLAETNDKIGDYYFAHNYEKHGFKKIDYSWRGSDGGTYYIWKFLK